MALLTGDIAGIIADALASAALPYPITLRRTVPGEVDPSEPWEPVPSTTLTFQASGFEDSYSEAMIASGAVQLGDRRIFLVAHSLATVPQTGDELVSRGESFVIVSVRTDPARALWDCQVNQGAQ